MTQASQANPRAMRMALTWEDAGSMAGTYAKDEFEFMAVLEGGLVRMRTFLGATGILDSADHGPRERHPTAADLESLLRNLRVQMALHAAMRTPGQPARRGWDPSDQTWPGPCLRNAATATLLA